MIHLIDGPRFSEFLDSNGNEPIEIAKVRTDIDFLDKAGLSNVKLRGRETNRVLEYFLLRTKLFRSDGKLLHPYLLSRATSDYATVWNRHMGEVEFHEPFFGKIGFICGNGSRRTLVCHPKKASEIERICVDIGGLSHSSSIGRDALYKRRKFDEMVEAKFSRASVAEVAASAFGRALLALGLARHQDGEFSVHGDGLLVDEMTRLSGAEPAEKAARLILRREQRDFAQVAGIIGEMEVQEKVQEPWVEPAGSAVGPFRDTFIFYQRITQDCSLDVRVAANALRGRAEGFADFGAITETYHRRVASDGERRTENYAFLSWTINSLEELRLREQLTDVAGWPQSKQEKSLRHAKFLARFVPENQIARYFEQKDIQDLHQKLHDSEIIDFNMKLTEHVSSQLGLRSSYCACLSDLLVASKTPVGQALFKKEVLELLQPKASRFRDSQGAYYYPDFRFIMASRLGLTLRSVDKILGYCLSKDPDFARRIWLFPSFGGMPARDRPDPELVATVMRPFDSINLNY